MAIHFNPLTKEPYLQLPEPLTNVIITPYREDQIKETVLVMTNILNDERVYRWLEGPPYPSLPKHGEDWVVAKIQETAAVVAALQEEFEIKSRQESQKSCEQKDVEVFDRCPFLCIREVTARDSTSGAPLQDTLIGKVGLSRYPFYEIRRNSWELQLVRDQNNKLPAGHDDIVWGVGNYLAPTHHGRGIVSQVVQTVIQDWAIPRMNVRHLRGSFWAGNVGSRKVFERNNFVEVAFLKDCVPENPTKKLGKMSVVVMEWKGLAATSSEVEEPRSSATNYQYKKTSN